jgi:hypothetical protein
MEALRTGRTVATGFDSWQCVLCEHGEANNVCGIAPPATPTARAFRPRGMPA